MNLKRLLLIGIGAAVLSGCGSSNYGGEADVTPAQSAARLEDEIKKIESNPNMPPQAKQHAIAALRRSAEMGKGMQSSGPTKK